jgi:hypothetical protein
LKSYFISYPDKAEQDSAPAAHPVIHTAPSRRSPMRLRRIRLAGAGYRLRRYAAPHLIVIILIFFPIIVILIFFPILIVIFLVIIFVTDCTLID